LAHAEQNLYGRLTFEEYLIMARDVMAYSQGRGYPTDNQQLTRQTHYVKTPRQVIISLNIQRSKRTQEFYEK